MSGYHKQQCAEEKSVYSSMTSVLFSAVQRELVLLLEAGAPRLRLSADESIPPRLLKSNSTETSLPTKKFNNHKMFLKVITTVKFRLQTG